jgi:linearmycin/streptolysin S transport system ATP-binding protein
MEAPVSGIIQVKKLCKQYDPPQGVMAVKDVSFDIESGEILSLLGPNGAGKTTTISIMSGLLGPTSGEVLIAGHSIHADPIDAKRLIGVVPDEIALYSTITARENLAFWGKMYGLRGQKLQQRINAVLEIAGLTDRANEKVETFSGGMKRRLNIAVSLIHEPKIIFMDEPTVGIDPQSRRRILDTVIELNRQGLTVLYTTHYLEEAQELSNRVGIIDHGQLIAIGTQEELRKLVNNFDTIRLEVSSQMSNEETAGALSQLPGVHRAYSENGHIVLQTPDASLLLSSLVAQANRGGTSIKKLEIQESNLEAVFLHLTGRALRD